MIIAILPYAPVILIVGVSIFMGIATNNYPLDQEKLDELRKRREKDC